MLMWLTLWVRKRVEVSAAFQQSTPLHVLLLLWLVWLSLQLTPLPFGLIQLVTPQAAAIHSEAFTILAGQPPAFATISLDHSATYQGLLKTVGYICTFYLALLLVNTRSRLMLLAWTLVISGVFQALYGSLMTLSGIEQIFWLDKEWNRGVVTGTFINRNHLAGYLVMCLSVGFGLLLGLLSHTRSEHWKARVRGWMQLLLSDKFRLRLFLILMVIALVMTRSRMGNISFIAGLLIAAVLGLVFLKHARRGLAILVVSILIIDVVVVGAWFGIDKVMERLDQTVVSTRISGSPGDGAQGAIQETDVRLGGDEVALLEERGLVYRDTKGYIRDYWLTGSGLGTFRYVYPMYRGPEISSYYDHVHNDYYELLAEVGIPGLLLLGCILVWSLITALRCLVKRRDQLTRSMALGVVMSLSAVLLHATVDFNLYIPANAMTLMVILALAFIANTLPRST